MLVREINFMYQNYLYQVAESYKSSKVVSTSKYARDDHQNLRVEKWLHSNIC